MVKADAAMITKAKDEVDKFIKEAKEYSGKEEDKLNTIGIPSIRIYNLWVEEALEYYKALGESGKKAVVDIQKFIAEMDKKKDIKVQLAMQVPHIMITKPFDKTMRKIEIGASGPALVMLENYIMPIIRALPGYRPLVGSAPRGQLERQIQEFIDSMATEWTVSSLKQNNMIS